MVEVSDNLHLAIVFITEFSKPTLLTRLRDYRNTFRRYPPRNIQFLRGENLQTDTSVDYADTCVPEMAEPDVYIVASPQPANSLHK